MISVGIDVSKGKSTVCVLKPYGEIVCRPFEMQHVEKDLEAFHNLLPEIRWRDTYCDGGYGHLSFANIDIFFIIRDISYLLSIRLQ